MKTSRKRKFQWRNYLHSIDLWPCLRDRHILINVWSERAEEPWASSPGLYKKTSRASQRRKLVSQTPPWPQLRFLPPRPCPDFPRQWSITGMSKQMNPYLPSHFWPLFFTAIDSKEDAALSTEVTIPVFFKKWLFELFLKREKTGRDNGQGKCA